MRTRNKHVLTSTALTSTNMQTCFSRGRLLADGAVADVALADAAH